MNKIKLIIINCYTMSLWRDELQLLCFKLFIDYNLDIVLKFVVS